MTTNYLVHASFPFDDNKTAVVRRMNDGQFTDSVDYLISSYELNPGDEFSTKIEAHQNTFYFYMNGKAAIETTGPRFEPYNLCDVKEAIFYVPDGVQLISYTFSIKYWLYWISDEETQINWNLV